MPFFDEVLIPSLKEGVDPETIKAGFDTYVSTQNETFSKGLRENRDAIKEEKTTIQNQLKEVTDQYAFLEGKEFNAEAFNKMNSDLETYKSSATKDDEAFRQQLTDQYEKGKKSYEETVTPTINSLKLQLDESNIARDKFHDQYKNYLKDSALRKAVSKIGADMDEWTFEGFKNSAKVDFDDGGITSISVKHDGGDIPIEDWQKIFPQTDRGKKLIKTPLNTGAGAKGSGTGTGGAVTIEDINNIEDPNARRVALDKYMKANS